MLVSLAATLSNLVVFVTLATKIPFENGKAGEQFNCIIHSGIFIHGNSSSHNLCTLVHRLHVRFYFCSQCSVTIFKKIKQSSVVGKMLSINSAYTYLNP